jgi:hypothetical protein
VRVEGPSACATVEINDSAVLAVIKIDSNRSANKSNHPN